MKTRFDIFTILLVMVCSCRVTRNKSTDQINNNSVIVVSPPEMTYLTSAPGKNIKYGASPVGTYKISENLYLDQSEITNYNWIEYLNWIISIYGQGSNEFKDAFPDSNIWNSNINLKNQNYFQWYLFHRVYWEYPVVGISFEQAEKFSKWRSNRVYEGMLICANVIKYHPTTNPDSVFTIEKYLSGEYMGYTPNKNYSSYPEYSLPDLISWKKGIAYADSVNIVSYKKCKPKYSDPGIRAINSIEKNSSSTSADPIEEASCYCKKRIVFHMHGNVREMSNEKGVSFGGGWTDSLKFIMTRDTFQYNKPNSWTGFRNICQYK